MVDAVASSASAPPPTQAGGSLEVEGGSVELDVESEAGGSAPAEAAPESDRGGSVDVEA